MRAWFSLATILIAGLSAGAQTPSPTPTVYTLTIQVENVNQEDGNLGVLVFNDPKGWPEDRFAALKDIVVPPHPGTVTVVVPGLAPGNYAVAIAHDVNKNHKLDKNFFGMPKEQWGMSNNPHATIKAPPFKTALFSLMGNMEIHIRLQ